MGKNGLKMGGWLSFFYKFSENREFFQGRFLPYILGIETTGQCWPAIDKVDETSRLPPYIQTKTFGID